MTLLDSMMHFGLCWPVSPKNLTRHTSGAHWPKGGHYTESHNKSVHKNIIRPNPNQNVTAITISWLTAYSLLTFLLRSGNLETADLTLASQLPYWLEPINYRIDFDVNYLQGFGVLSPCWPELWADAGGKASKSPESAMSSTEISPMAPVSLTRSVSFWTPFRSQDWGFRVDPELRHKAAHKADMTHRDLAAKWPIGDKHKFIFMQSSKTLYLITTLRSHYYTDIDRNMYFIMLTSFNIFNNNVKTRNDITSTIGNWDL